MKLTTKLKLIATRETTGYNGEPCARLIFLDDDEYTREYDAPLENLSLERNVEYFVTFDFIQGTSKKTGNRFSMLALRTLKPVK